MVDHCPIKLSALISELQPRLVLTFISSSPASSAYSQCYLWSRTSATLCCEASGCILLRSQSPQLTLEPNCYWTPTAHGACEWESDRWGIENQTANLGPLQQQHRLRLQLYTLSFNVMLILIPKLDWFLKKKKPFCHRFLQMGIRLLNRLRVTWLRCACFRSLTPDPHRGSPLKCHVERSHCGSSRCQTDASLALLPHRM